MAKESREMVWLQCTETGDLNYRTEIKVAGGPQKIEVKKYSPRLRRHTMHKVKRKWLPVASCQWPVKSVFSGN
jgi:large subunit ribosomal protein L33